MAKNNKCENRLLNLLSAQEWHLDRLYGRYSFIFSHILKNNTTGKLSPDKTRQFERAMMDFNNEVEKLFQQQISNSFSISNACNDDLALKYIKGLDVKEKKINSWLKTNDNAVESFINRKAAGLNLSDRVWSLTQQTKDSLENVLESGILSGRSAAETARDLRKYLKEPDRNFRRVRNTDGKLILSNPAKNYHPGQGVYRSSYKNALRVSRNEINIAYRTNDFERRQNMPFVTGQKVRLSAAHPQYDICDELIGTYPKSFLFVGWHPNCLCISETLLLPRDKFKDYLGGGDIDQRHQITSVPKSAIDYLNANAKKINNYSSKPYFIANNFKFSGGKFVPVSSPLPTPRVIPAPKPAPAPAPIPKTAPKLRAPRKATVPKAPAFIEINDVKGLNAVMVDFAVQNPQYFAKGFKNVGITRKAGVNGFTTMTGDIYLKPEITEQVIGAVNHMKKGIPTTYAQEVSMSTFHHEVMHNANKVGNMRMTKIQTKYMELSNEFVSRNRLPEFMEKFGGKLENRGLMVNRFNTGYNTMVRNFDKLIEIAKADKSAVLKDVEIFLINERYDKQVDGLINAIIKHSKVKIGKMQAKQLLKGALQYSEGGYEDFIKKFI